MSADFESQLQRQAMRELPRDWRAEILAVAAAPPASAWPSARAWTSLAGVWAVILILNWSAPDEPQVAANSPPMTFQTYATLRQQTLITAQLFGPSEADRPMVATPVPPKPRSERPRRQLIG